MTTDVLQKKTDLISPIPAAENNNSSNTSVSVDDVKIDKIFDSEEEVKILVEKANDALMNTFGINCGYTIRNEMPIYILEFPLGLKTVQRTYFTNKGLSSLHVQFQKKFKRDLILHVDKSLYNYLSSQTNIKDASNELIIISLASMLTFSNTSQINLYNCPKLIAKNVHYEYQLVYSNSISVKNGMQKIIIKNSPPSFELKPFLTKDFIVELCKKNNVFISTCNGQFNDDLDNTVCFMCVWFWIAVAFLTLFLIMSVVAAEGFKERNEYISKYNLISAQFNQSLAAHELFVANITAEFTTCQQKLNMIENLRDFSLENLVVKSDLLLMLIVQTSIIASYYLLFVKS